jgi:hypothetical protein
MDPDQTARMRRLVRIHAGRKPIMLFLSWRGSFKSAIKVKCMKMMIRELAEKLFTTSGHVFYCGHLLTDRYR